MRRLRAQYEKLDWFDQTLVRWCLIGLVVSLLATVTIAIWAQDFQVLEAEGVIALTFVIVGASAMVDT